VFERRERRLEPITRVGTPHDGGQASGAGVM
jgi:hypothetical protein